MYSLAAMKDNGDDDESVIVVRRSLLPGLLLSRNGVVAIDRSMFLRERG